MATLSKVRSGFSVEFDSADDSLVPAGLWRIIVLEAVATSWWR
jgi:hypothetical protein